MTTIMPEGEKLRQAVQWISAERQQDESKRLIALIQEASSRFNLSPKEEMYLTSFYEQQEN
ncbi:hypothetical protein ACFL9T_00535 [Thermodesulfobacteriota bacterium]